MNKIVSVCFVFLLVTGVTSGSVVAQEANDEYEYEFSESVKVVDYNVNLDNGVTTIQFETDYRTEVVITDAFIDTEAQGQDRQMNRETYTISGNETIEFNSTVVDNSAGVTVDTEGQLAAFAEEGGAGPILGKGAYSPISLMTQGVAGFAMGISLVLGLAYWKRVKYESEVKQEL